MADLLALEHVSKWPGRGVCDRLVLDDVSFSMQPGEIAVVWGMRRSGRSTLLLVASGLEPVDRGVVRFDGRALGGRGRTASEGLCFCRDSFHAGEGATVLEQLRLAQLSRGVRSSQARAAAVAALRRVDAGHCAALAPSELEPGETVRVRIARALTRAPRLLVIDEPLLGVDPLEREGVMAQLHSLAAEGIAVLMSTGDPAGLSGVDHALSLVQGRLQWDRVGQRGEVVPLRRVAQT